MRFLIIYRLDVKLCQNFQLSHRIPYTLAVSLRHCTGKLCAHTGRSTVFGLQSIDSMRSRCYKYRFSLFGLDSERQLFVEIINFYYT